MVVSLHNHQKHLLPMRVTVVVSRHNHRNTLTHIEGNCGGLQFSSSKTLTIIEVKCGGGWFRELKTLTHDGVWYGSVAPPDTTTVTINVTVSPNDYEVTSPQLPIQLST